ncbi:MAG: peroxiredoxin [Alphaproteobacteria bacterium]
MPKQTSKFAVKKPPAPPRGGPKTGDKAPLFRLPATDGGMIGPARLKGKPYILYFYPKDDTSGCTAQACGFRDALADFTKLGAAVIGVSKDGIASHGKFIAKHQLNFPLASDETGEALERFGVWVEKSMYGRKYMGIERSTFLVDGKGVIRAVWRKVSVPGHVEDVRKALQELTKAP